MINGEQTMLGAQRDFADFQVKTDMELRAWLKMILTRNLLTLARRYETHNRTAACKVSLQDRLEKSSAFIDQQLATDHSSPSMKLMKKPREQMSEEV